MDGKTIFALFVSIVDYANQRNAPQSRDYNDERELLSNVKTIKDCFDGSLVFSLFSIFAIKSSL
ncbi:hypothetical protein [Halopelagius fulvigenes]|uniref:Uncharacterized protein n=1 Tax=Halopelagius fulvigenes TaxID=1198324 RepID=A0ABD5TSC3_9EURY